ncbi:hypothetical protein [Paraburkholderia aromaticivorans]|uniref:hypothetical protein n=1 Tax=Paraburkholderia aromaticivorans TaxID=2026199 RepID=UPI00145620C3|nr:hypothetical protein [Paraburkholderia aromaticivorans]
MVDLQRSEWIKVDRGERKNAALMRLIAHTMPSAAKRRVACFSAVFRASVMETGQLAARRCRQFADIRPLVMQ